MVQNYSGKKIKRFLYKAIATPSIHIMKTLFGDIYGSDAPSITDRYIEYPWAIKKLLNKKGNVLDVGCSGSIFPYILDALGYWVWGIDIRPCFEPNFTFVQDDICDTDFEDEEFDIITAISTIEHIKDDYQAIMEIYRILKPEGLFLMTVPYGKYKETKFHRVYDNIRLEHILKDFYIEILLQNSPEGKYQLALLANKK